MQWFAAVLAVLAIIFFAADYITRRWVVSLGLALLTAAWMVQLIVQSGGHLLVK